MFQETLQGLRVQRNKHYSNNNKTFGFRPLDGTNYVTLKNKMLL